MPWRKAWQPTPVFLSREFHGQRSFADYSPWGRKESDLTEWLTILVSLSWDKYKEVPFSSVAQSCPTLCHPMNRSTPGLPVHHKLLEFTQTLAHRVGDTIQPSHPLSSPSPPAPNPSKHQGLFQWVSNFQLNSILSENRSVMQELKYILTALLRYNPPSIILIFLKYTIQWFLE